MGDCGSYESPCVICEETLCGCTGEIPCENSVEDWDLVSCKKCLNLRGAYEFGREAEENAIVAQMGDMADFFNRSGDYS